MKNFKKNWVFWPNRGLVFEILQNKCPCTYLGIQSKFCEILKKNTGAVDFAVALGPHNYYNDNND